MLYYRSLITGVEKGILQLANIGFGYSLRNHKVHLYTYLKKQNSLFVEKMRVSIKNFDDLTQLVVVVVVVFISAYNENNSIINEQQSHCMLGLPEGHATSWPVATGIQSIDLFYRPWLRLWLVEPTENVG